MKNHETTLKNHGNQPKTMKHHETTLKNQGNQPKPMKHHETTYQFSASGRVSVTNKEDVAKFFEEVYNATGTSFNMKSGRPDRNKESFRGFRKCIMNVSHSEKSKKLQRPNLQRKCPATITFCLEKPREVLERDSSERVAKKTIEKEFPLSFNLNMIHNHQINRHEHTRFGNVSEETKRRFEKYFEEGYTASAAWNAFRDEIVANNPENYHILLGNRRIVPDYFWPHKFFGKWVEDKMGIFNGVQAYERLKSFCREFDEKNQLIEKLPEGEKYAAIKQTEGGETVVVILDRFMRRVHAMIPQSGDMMIVDATSNLDRSDTKLFHLMCPSAIGGLPLGTLIVTKEDESTIRVALETLKENLPEDAFYGRGRNLGPHLAMTDDCLAERNALRTVWPAMIALLCHFHILQVLQIIFLPDFILPQYYQAHEHVIATRMCMTQPRARA